MSRNHNSVSVRRAQDIGTTVVVPDFTITSVEPIDTDGKSVGWIRHQFRADADALFAVLKASLPGGTLDQLTCRLLQDKVSSFVVPS